MLLNISLAVETGVRKSATVLFTALIANWLEKIGRRFKAAAIPKKSNPMLLTTTASRPATEPDMHGERDHINRRRDAESSDELRLLIASMHHENRAQAEYLRSIVHGLRNALQGIEIASDYLRSRSNDQKTNKEAVYLQLIRAQSQRMSELVAELAQATKYSGTDSKASGSNADLITKPPADSSIKQ